MMYMGYCCCFLEPNCSTSATTGSTCITPATSGEWTTPRTDSIPIDGLTRGNYNYSTSVTRLFFLCSSF